MTTAYCDPRAMHLTMLGPRGVGKTTLLAAMTKNVEDLNAAAGHKGFVLHPSDEETVVKIQRYREKLAAITENFHENLHARIDPTRSEFFKFNYELRFEGGREARLVFHDFGGEILEGHAPATHLPAIAAHSRIIFNLVDAVTLMEYSDAHSIQRNGHELVAAALEQHWGSSTSPLLILFVLSKCETYMRDLSRYHELLRRFEILHQPCLRFIDRHSHAAGVLIPVQTTGCLRFVEKNEDNEPIFHARGRYRPHDADQPLRYALAFALAQLARERGLLSRVRGRLTGRNERYRVALNAFADSRNLSYRTYGLHGLAI